MCLLRLDVKEMNGGGRGKWRGREGRMLIGMAANFGWKKGRKEERKVVVLLLLLKEKNGYRGIQNAM